MTEEKLGKAPPTHKRFKRNVFAFKKDFTGSLAKWLVSQSPYVVPENLSECVQKFDEAIEREFSFDNLSMCEISLSILTHKISELLQSIPEIAALNEPKSGHNSNIFVSRYDSGPGNPDDDFIDIVAVAQNITCDFAERADAEAYLDVRYKG